MKIDFLQPYSLVLLKMIPLLINLWISIPFVKRLMMEKEMRAMFFDVSKAFDRVWHQGLLYKRQTVGITGSLLLWFTDCLHNRKQRVVLPGGISDWTTISAAVLHGSFLAHFCF